LYFVVSIVKKQIEINKNEDTRQELVSILESQQAENQELEAAISEGDESALAEEYARKKGYVMPDDRVYVDITPGEEQ
jgi:cell division protein FtsB